MNDELELNERVEVIATFGSGLELCVPRRFRRPNGREIEVSELGLRHPVAKGRRTMHIFDGERLTWRLTREAEHG